MAKHNKRTNDPDYWRNWNWTPRGQRLIRIWDNLVLMITALILVIVGSISDINLPHR